MMKKYLFILVLIYSSFTTARAQDWATPGARWYFSFNQLQSFGYIKIENIGDTIIAGHDCNILTKTKFGYTFPGYYDTTYLANEFTYEDSEIVYCFRGNQFRILYNFNALPLDTWNIWGNLAGCDSLGQVKVDSIGTEVINNDTLKYLWTSPTLNSTWQFYGKIVQKLGCLGYLFPETRCFFDHDEGGPFRCYSDSSGWNYREVGINACDSINNVNDFASTELFVKLYPNPCSDFFTIETIDRYLGDTKLDVLLTDSWGKEIMHQSFINGNAIFITAKLSSGVYFILFKEVGDKIVFVKKLVKI